MSGIVCGEAAGRRLTGLVGVLDGLSNERNGCTPWLQVETGEGDGGLLEAGSLDAVNTKGGERLSVGGWSVETITLVV